MTTPGQTVGPFFGYALPYAGDGDLVPAGRADALRLTGRVLDGSGAGVPDALVEIWQPDASGTIVMRAGSLRRDGWTFTGFGRCATDRTGRYRFSTVRPGPVTPGAASFFAMTIFARGLLDRLVTRVYLPGTVAGPQGGDAVLRSLPAARGATMIAADDADGLVFDIRLQGEGETVFLDFTA